jgi:methenyltetrahydrofolate cyclohydrolase
MSISEFHSQVADHGTFCGGGSVAAITAAGSAALVDLVIGLSQRRKSNKEHAERLGAAQAHVRELQARFQLAADADAAALNELMAAQQNLKRSEERGSYAAALESAAKAPLETAGECLDLLQVIEENMRLATTFTVSDLGAASSLALGSLQAATMMCEVNLALLAAEGDEFEEAVLHMEQTSRQLISDATEIAQRVDRYTRSTIRRNE